MHASLVGLRRAGMAVALALCACGGGGGGGGGKTNHAPVAAIVEPAADRTATVGDAVTFTGTCTDEDGETPTGRWTIPGSDHATASGVGPVAAAFGARGTSTATFTCTDAAGATGSATRTVDVRLPSELVALSISAPRHAMAQSRWGYAVVVRPVNGSGTPVVQAGLQVTVSVQGLTNGLSGTTTATTSDDGSAVFSDVAFTTVAATGMQTLAATASGLVTGTADVNVQPPAPAPYDITVRFLGDATVEQRAAFDRARMRWETVVIADLSDFPVSDNTGPDCQNQDLVETIDDLLIFAKVAYIDGAGGILGRAGPCYIRNSNHLPFIGQMQFDSADVAELEADGTLEAVILHEMGHVLGFGTLWSYKGLVNTDNAADPYFLGSNAISAFGDHNNGSAYGGTPIPVEATGGTGTALSHWREDVFKRELMTGWLSGSDQPLSATTIGAMADLGYGVAGDLAGVADPFDVASASLRARGEAPEHFVGDDVLPGPVVIVDDGT